MTQNKRQEINDQFEDDENAPSFVESEEEKPQVVVLNQGDLTETEAEIEQKKIDQGRLFFLFYFLPLYHAFDISHFPPNSNCNAHV